MTAADAARDRLNAKGFLGIPQAKIMQALAGIAAPAQLNPYDPFGAIGSGVAGAIAEHDRQQASLRTLDQQDLENDIKFRQLAADQQRADASTTSARAAMMKASQEKDPLWGVRERMDYVESLDPEHRQMLGQIPGGWSAPPSESNVVSTFHPDQMRRWAEGQVHNFPQYYGYDPANPATYEQAVQKASVDYKSSGIKVTRAMMGQDENNQFVTNTYQIMLYPGDPGYDEARTQGSMGSLQNMTDEQLGTSLRRVQSEVANNPTLDVGTINQYQMQIHALQAEIHRRQTGR